MGKERNGYIYRPKYRARDGTYKESSIWWMQYTSRRGKVERESTGCREEIKARVKLAEKIRERDLGLSVGAGVTRTEYADLERFILADYRINKRRSKDRLARSLGHLRGFFARVRATEIDAALINDYIEHRLDEKASNATINRELSALKRAFNLAFRSERVRSVPVIAKLEEDNARSGFFEPHQEEMILSHLPDHIRSLVRAASITGWRMNAELSSRKWHHVDFTKNTIRLDPGETKNKKGRTRPLDSELRDLLQDQQRRARELGTKLGRVIPWVFFTLQGERLNKDRYYSQWKKARERAGVPGRVPHDFRRTAVREMNRAGVVQATAMRLTGHLTPAVYHRYSIDDDESLREAVEKVSRARLGNTLSEASNNE